MRPPWEIMGGLGEKPSGYPWELYDLNRDWTQAEDVAAKYPAKLKELQKLFWAEAKKYQVLPLDSTVATRLITPRPSITAGRNVLTWTAPLTGTPYGDAPSVPQRVVHLQGRDRDPRRWCRGHAHHHRWSLRGLRLLSAGGKAGLHLEPR